MNEKQMTKKYGKKHKFIVYSTLINGKMQELLNTSIKESIAKTFRAHYLFRLCVLSYPSGTSYGMLLFPFTPSNKIGDVEEVFLKIVL